MSREDKRKRRLAVLEDVKDGMSDEEAAQKHGISVSYTATLRHQDGALPFQNHTIPKVSTFAILKLVVDGVPEADVARRFRVTRQRVSRIVVQARKAGWDV